MLYLIVMNASRIHVLFAFFVRTAHLASELSLALKRHQPNLGLTDQDVMFISLAGLLHDIGFKFVIH